jgi:hypothetical protein
MVEGGEEGLTAAELFEHNPYTDRGDSPYRTS